MTAQGGPHHGAQGGAQGHQHVAIDPSFIVPDTDDEHGHGLQQEPSFARAPGSKLLSLQSRKELASVTSTSMPLLTARPSRLHVDVGESARASPREHHLDAHLDLPLQQHGSLAPAQAGPHLHRAPLAGALVAGRPGDKASPAGARGALKLPALGGATPTGSAPSTPVSATIVTKVKVRPTRYALSHKAMRALHEAQQDGRLTGLAPSASQGGAADATGDEGAEEHDGEEEEEDGAEEGGPGGRGGGAHPAKGGPPRGLYTSKPSPAAISPLWPALAAGRGGGAKGALPFPSHPAQSGTFERASPSPTLVGPQAGAKTGRQRSPPLMLLGGTSSSVGAAGPGPQGEGAAGAEGAQPQQPQQPASPGGQVEDDPFGDEPPPSLYLDDDDELTGRLLSLPNIMCHAANGDVFLVGLGDVQNMLHKRRLGPKGVAVLRRFENATMSAWDVSREKANDTYVLKWRQQHEQRMLAKAGKAGDHPSLDGTSPGPGAAKGGAAGAKSAAAVAVAAAAAGVGGEGPGGDGSLLGLEGDALLTRELELEVSEHVEASMKLVEAHRQHLVTHSARALAEVARRQAEEATQKRKAAAVDFVVNHLIPEKILGMANTRRTKLAASNQLFRKMKASLAAADTGADGKGGAAAAGAAAQQAEEAAVNSPRGARNWNKLNARTKDVLSNMPFMENWNTAITKLKRDDKGSGWDNLLVANSVYVKGGNTGDSQGAAVYVYRCQQLGVTACTQVVQQLRCPEANMAHCKLGRRGAQALRHALATNTTITSLDLSDNALDAHAVTEVINGLTSGAAAAQTTKARKVLEDKWKRLDWVKAFQHTQPDPTALAPPPTLQGMLDRNKEEGAGPGSRGPSSPGSPSSPHRRASTTASRPESPTKQAALLDGPLNRSQKPVHALSRKVGGADGQPATSESGAAPAPPARSLFQSFLSRVKILDLSTNLLGVNGAKVIADLLNPATTPHQFLVELRINKCGIPEAGGMAIFAAIANGNNTLSTLHMSNNACGNAAARVLGDMLRVNAGLKELDLSWNQIKPDGVHDLCPGLEENTTLLKLSLAWNGLEDQGVMRLGQMLQANKGLKHLDLTNTRMGAQGCLMLGEGIKANECLEDLILNGNSVGDDGARHLMSALKQNNTLQYLGLQGSNMSSGMRGQNGGADFNPLAPDGSYTLLLSNPADRAIATQLCQLEVNSAKGDLMRNIKLEGRNITNVKGMHWPDQLPVSGMLTFDFVTKRAQKTMQVMDHKKFQALVGQLDSHAMSDKDKSALVDVMAPFTYLYCHQIAQVLKCFTMGDELVRSAALLFTRAADLEESVEAMTSVMQERDIHALQQQLGWYSYCRFSNPTGHYELNLTTHVHQALASRLKDVAFSEPSDSNNWHNIIHDLYSQTNKTPSNYGPPEAWKGQVPARGTLSFDFVSTVLPPDDAKPIADDQLIDFLHHGIGIQFNEAGVPLPEADFADADVQVALLRQEVGHQFFFTSTQVIRVMSCFAAGPHKVEVAVMLYALLIDRKNFWQIMYSLRPLEQGLLMWRLGPHHVFDRTHPSGHYILDLSNPAHEQTARKLVEVAAQNSEVPNFWNIRLQGCKKNIVENRNMWGTFTAETFTPFLEFDFLGADAGETLLNKTKAEWEAMNKGDKLDLVTKQSRRMEMMRIKDMYGHFWDGSGWQCPAWRSAGQLFKPLLNKSPWLAAWDRLMRLLVRSDTRSGDIGSDSYLEDMFDAHSTEDGELASEGFEALCKEWGYTKSEMHFHYRPLFESAARPSASSAGDGQQQQQQQQQGGAPTSDGGTTGGGAGGQDSVRSSLAGPLTPTGHGASTSGKDPQAPAEVMVLDFSAFVDLFMRDPLPEYRFKEVPVQNLLVVANAAKALKGLRKGLLNNAAAAAKK